MKSFDQIFVQNTKTKDIVALKIRLGVNIEILFVIKMKMIIDYMRVDFTNPTENFYFIHDTKISMFDYTTGKTELILRNDINKPKEMVFTQNRLIVLHEDSRISVFDKHRYDLLNWIVSGNLLSLAGLSFTDTLLVTAYSRDKKMRVMHHTVDGQDLLMDLPCIPQVVETTLFCGNKLIVRYDQFVKIIEFS
jgi:hypothetical protein